MGNYLSLQGRDFTASLPMEVSSSGKDRFSSIGSESKVILDRNGIGKTRTSASDAIGFDCDKTSNFFHSRMIWAAVLVDPRGKSCYLLWSLIARKYVIRFLVG